MSKASLENEIRSRLFSAILPILREMGEEPLAVSNSEYTFPVVDSEGNETFANLKISIPRGTRSEDGYIPYDGYAAAEEYAAELEDKRLRSAAKEEKKRKAEEEKERKRAARKTIKTMKKDVKEIFTSEEE